MSEEIRRCLTEVESCFRLLLPFDLAPSPGAAVPAAASNVSAEGRPHQAAAPNHEDEEQPCCSKTLPTCARHPGATGREGPPSEDEDEDEDSDQEGFVRRHGLGSHKYTLDVELSSGTWLPGSHRLVGALPHCSAQAAPVPASLATGHRNTAESSDFLGREQGRDPQGWGEGCLEAVGPVAAGWAWCSE